MKINITEDINKDGLLSHLILHSLSESLASQLAKEGNTNKGVILDVQLKVNGNEINILFNSNSIKEKYKEYIKNPKNCSKRKE